MPVRDEGGEVTKVTTGRYESDLWQPELITTDWKRSFVFTPKTSINGTRIGPLSKVYTRQREAYDAGQRLLFVDWMTPAEYVMAILKGNEDV